MQRLYLFFLAFLYLFALCVIKLLSITNINVLVRLKQKIQNFIYNICINASRFNSGIFAEYIVILWYLFRLYRPLSHRFKTKIGEIDIILKRRDVIVAVEVKYRNEGLTHRTIGRKQIERIRNTIQLFLIQNNLYNDVSIRVDLVIIKPLDFPLQIRNIM